MDEWENIEDSVWSAPILRYKADMAALDLLIRSLVGLQKTLAMHIDLKSRCLIQLLSTSLLQVAAMRQELRPVSDFHNEVQEEVSIHRPVKLVVYVNKIEFLRRRKACVRVMAELREVLLDIHEQWKSTINRDPLLGNHPKTIFEGLKMLSEIPMDNASLPTPAEA